MKGKFYLILLVALAILANIYIRLGPAYLPGSSSEAKSYVLNLGRENAQKAVEDRFKDLPEQVKSKVVREVVGMQDSKSKKTAAQAIRDKEKQLKAKFQDASGQTFLMEADPYHWMRLVNNLLTNGKIADKVVGHDRYDSFMLAPVGMKAEPSLHQNLYVYLAALIFKIIKLIAPNISLMSVVFYIPVLITCIALILLYFICRSLGDNKLNISGYFAILALGLSPIYLERSMAGWFDTDPCVILFSLLCPWLFYLSLKNAISFRIRSLLILLAALSIGLFSFTWDGWWYVFDLIIFTGIYYVLNLYSVSKSTKEKVNLRAPLLVLGLYAVLSLIFANLFCGQETTGKFITGPLQVISAKDYLEKQFWPNAFITVKELRAANLLEVGFKLGGILILLLSVLYLLFLGLIAERPKDYRQKQFMWFLFSFWVLIMGFVSLKAVRFALLLLIPVSIYFGLCCEALFGFLGSKLERFKNTRKFKEAILGILAVFFLCLFTSKSWAFRSFGPTMERGWWDLLNKIKTSTPKNAILNSWWDYGHWFKAVAQRRVIFDGATQNTAMSYWMGRVLTTDNELEACGILRMLNSGSNSAFEELEKLGIERLKCLDILNEIIVLNKQDALAALAKYVKQPAIRSKIIGLTHNPQPAYFIVEPSLIRKMPSISLLGGWNFKKADIYQKFKKLSQEEFFKYMAKVRGYNQAEAQKMRSELLFLGNDDAASWISKEESFYFWSDKFVKKGNLLLFDDGFAVDLANFSASYFNNQKSEWRTPKTLFYFDGLGLKEVPFKEGNSESAVLLIQDKDNYQLISLDYKLAKSMFTRLYYLRGQGLNCFKQVMTQELDEDEGRIIVYQVLFDKCG